MCNAINLMEVACRYLILDGALIQIKVFLGDRGIGNYVILIGMGVYICMETGCANIGSLKLTKK